MSAIAGSGISLKALSIYRQTQACSVPMAGLQEVTALLERKHFKITASELKEFSIKIGPRVPTEKDLFPPYDDDDAPSDRDVKGFVRLLQNIANLEDIQLDVFTNEVNKLYAEKVFPAISSRLHWPDLRRCTLAGLYTDEASLLQFLKNHSRLESLAIERVTLITGPWDNIFKVLNEDMDLLTHLLLSRIQWNVTGTILGNEVNLFPRWEEETPQAVQKYWKRGHALVSRDSMWVHTREFDAVELKRGLDFWPMPFCSLF